LLCFKYKKEGSQQQSSKLQQEKYPKKEGVLALDDRKLRATPLHSTA